MIEIHTTATGQKLFISQMDDDHLLNMIRFLCDKISKYRQALVAPENISQEQAVLYGITEEQSREDVELFIRPTIRRLYPYVTEATLRGLQITSFLQKTFNRSNAEQMSVFPARGSEDPQDWELDHNDVIPF